MERVLEALRILLFESRNVQGLSPVALSDIIIASGPGRREWRLIALFSDGSHAWVAVRAADCRDFCARRSLADLTSLRSALLAEGRLMLQQRRAGSRGGGGLPGREQIAETLRLGLWARLCRWRERYRRRRMEARFGVPWQDPRGRHTAGLLLSIDQRAAEARGLALLRQNLSAAQRRQLAEHHSFDVIGGMTGNRYRIRHGRQMNVEQLDRRGRRMCGWCFFPRGGLVAGDIMLAQKLALELFEAEALAVAQRYRIAQGLDWPPIDSPP